MGILRGDPKACLRTLRQKVIRANSEGEMTDGAGYGAALPAAVEAVRHGDAE
jgi:hypothetical protein